MKPEPSTERFDCVGYTRDVRDRIGAEIATMDDGELTRCLRGTRPPSPNYSRQTRVWRMGVQNGMITMIEIIFELARLHFERLREPDRSIPTVN